MNRVSGREDPLSTVSPTEPADAERAGHPGAAGGRPVDSAPQRPLTSGSLPTVSTRVDSAVGLREHGRAPKGRPCRGPAVIGFGVHVQEAVRELFSRPHGSGR